MDNDRQNNRNTRTTIVRITETIRITGKTIKRITDKTTSKLSITELIVY